MNLSCWLGDHKTCHFPVLILDTLSEEGTWPSYEGLNQRIHIYFKGKKYFKVI